METVTDPVCALSELLLGRLGLLDLAGPSDRPAQAHAQLAAWRGDARLEPWAELVDELATGRDGFSVTPLLDHLVCDPLAAGTVGALPEGGTVWGERRLASVVCQWATQDGQLEVRLTDWSDAAQRPALLVLWGTGRARLLPLCWQGRRARWQGPAPTGTRWYVAA